MQITFHFVSWPDLNFIIAQIYLTLKKVQGSQFILSCVKTHFNRKSAKCPGLTFFRQIIAYSYTGISCKVSLWTSWLILGQHFGFAAEYLFIRSKNLQTHYLRFFPLVNLFSPFLFFFFSFLFFSFFLLTGATQASLTCSSKIEEKLSWVQCENFEAFLPFIFNNIKPGLTPPPHPQRELKKK